MFWKRRRCAITQKVKVDIVDPYTFGILRCIDGAFRFDTGDPFAVHLVLNQDLLAPPVLWCFSRELLLTGINQPEGDGDGDVSVWPLARENLRRYVGIMLTSPDAAVVTMTPMKPVKKFVSEMDRLLPLSEASGDAEIDSYIHRMLQGKLA